jgi:chromosome segregation ATPase
MSVEVKERGMTELMKSVGDIQRSGQDREHDLTNRLALAESQVVECREKILALCYEKKSLEEALEAAKSACSVHEITIASLRKEISDSRLGSAQHESALQLERDCLTKAEEKASEERAKRVALAAKLNAQLQEHGESEKQLRESLESMRRNTSEQIRLLNEENQNKDDEIQKCTEVIAGLEAYQLSLKKSLSEQRSVWEKSKEEEIGRLKEEIDDLKSRLTSEVRNLQSAGMVNATKIQELEAILRQSALERKR